MKKLIITIFCIVFLISFTTALEFDNKLTYSEDDLKVELTNWFGLGVDYGSAELKSHTSVNEVLQVGAGEQVVMYYDFLFTELYKDGIGDVKFIDMKTGKIIQKNYTFVYWTTETRQRDICLREEVRKGFEDTNSFFDCVEYAKEDYKWTGWLPYNSRDIPSKGIRIGLKINVEMNEHTDGIWTIGGKAVEKHAEWASSLNTNLISYYKLDNSVTDSLGTNDLTDAATTDVEGIIGRSRNIANNQYLYDSTFSGLVTGSNDFTFCSWAYPTTWEAYPWIMGYGTAATDQFIGLTWTSPSTISLSIHGVANIDAPMSLNKWNFICAVQDSGTQRLYVNGTQYGTNTRSLNIGTSTFYIGTHSRNTAEEWRGRIDEVGYWSRTLSPSEIVYLYNSGVGMTYQSDSPPVVNLSSPVNAYNSSSNYVNFNCSAVDNKKIQNVSLVINGAINYTETDGVDNVTELYRSVFLNNGLYNWTCLAYDNLSQIAWASSNRTLNVSFLSSINVNLNSPADALSQKTYNITFNCSATDNVGITQLNLIIDNVVNKSTTNSTAGQNLSIVQEVTNFADGTHSWGCNATDGVESSWVFAGTRSFIVNTTPNINYITPPTKVNNTNISLGYIPISVNVTTSYFKNITYLVQNTNGTTETKSYTNQTYDVNFTNTPTGTFKYNVTICTTTGKCNNTETRIIHNDVSPPIINLSEFGTINYLITGTNLTLNWSIIENYPDTCILSFAGINRTIICSANTTQINATSFDNRNLTIYVNDTFGNSAQETISWTYRVFENSRTFSESTISGAIETYSLNASYDSSFIGISVLLNYDNVNYSTTTSDTGTTKVYSRDLVSPFVSTEETNDFYFVVLLSSVNGTFEVETYHSNQTISPFLVDDCTIYNKTLLNFTMIDEDTQEKINGTINVNVNLYTYGTFNLVNSYNKSFDYITTESSAICLEDIGQNFSMGYQIQFNGETTEYFTKSKNIQRMTINNDSLPQTINLFNLKRDRGYPFSVIVVGNLLSETGNKDLLVDVQRRYLAENQFKSVESSITSADGTGITHLVQFSEVYNFLISYNGEILGTFNNYQVQCANPSIGQCSIILNLARVSGDAPVFENFGDVEQTFLLNEETKTLYHTFSSTDGESKSVRGEVLILDGYGNTTICNTTILGTSGTLICSIPTIYQNTSFVINTFVDSEYAGSNVFTQGVDIDWKGADIFIYLLMLSALVLLFIGHPITIVVGAMLGLVMPVILLSIAGATFGTIIGAVLYYIAGGIIIIIVMKNKV